MVSVRGPGFRVALNEFGTRESSEPLQYDPRRTAGPG
jgi:hypothetical protein